ncbi:MAG: 2-amino-4-hydroxy-6-hydroxymethyldihydropteridine diphosphokinase [Chloroflexota bacterium]|nr:2-amino-4-hydroxy-6-hydroxymethyldihydropteridine diphosphokinase [Chloroflexota bacterium]MDE2919851.1 2-amino-4-hydroxy-6-hydroxymethyldihydropteridine diphosphokinase [Chloroflexota bacterium]
MTDVLIGLGSNVGDRLAHLRKAVDGLRSVLRHVEVSHVYETSPEGVLTQPPFLNAAVRGETTEGPQRLFFWAKSLELAAGRRPGPRLGPRQLDLDIIAFGDLVVATPRLNIPHAAFAERGFVLAPLADLAPDLVLPGAEATVSTLAKRVGRAGIERAYPPESLSAPR